MKSNLHIKDVIDLFDDCKTRFELRYVYHSCVRELLWFDWPKEWRARMEAEFKKRKAAFDEQ